MRIANNIMAMNTHRVYSINNTNISKSIEKLSSGYRINRAGDDAAGLAISEKMRAQIRGLQMASKNSQDAISMVQTAEGALQTTHDILQRMREIAVQSASDTNETTIDRAALDKEFQALMAEIDDTASKTAFNDQKLIDGTFQKTALDLANIKTSGTASTATAYVSSNTAAGTYTASFGELATTSTTKSADAVPGEAPDNFDPSSLFGAGKVTVEFDVSNARGNEAVTAVEPGITLTNNDSFTGSLGFAEVNLTANDVIGDTLNEATFATGKLTLTGTADAAIFKLEIDGETYTADAIDLANGDLTATLKGADGKEITLDLDGTYNAGTGDFAALQASIAGVSGVFDDTGVTGVTGDSLVDEAAWGDDAELAIANAGLNANDPNVFEFDVTATGNTANSDVEVKTRGVIDLAQVDGYELDEDGVGTFTEDADMEVLLSDGGKMTISVKAGTTIDELATALNEITAAAIDENGEGSNAKSEIITQGSAWTPGSGFPATGEWDGTWTVATTGAEDADDLTAVTFTITGENGEVGGIATVDMSAVIESTDSGKAMAAGAYDFTLDFGELGKMTITVNVEEITGEADTDAANAQITAIKKAIADFGSGTGVGLAISNGVTAADEETTTTPIDAKDRTVDVTMAGVVDKDGNTAKATLKVGDTGYSITGVDADGKEYTVSVSFGKDTDGNDIALTEADFADEATLAKFLSGDDTATTLQDQTITVGTTKGSDFVVQTGANQGDELSINIDAMNAWTLGIDRSNIASREAASKAITAVNDAINQVSMQRADLGALQNRLEFKIQNLDISAENLQSAESRIRDLDMAAEMTTFTRNNILAQAATAMLAQANSLPQGVLQLLG